jgi:hypothetical protein
MVFFKNLVTRLARPGTFRIGLGFTGFRDAQVDWAGFKEPRNAAEGMLTNWRFQPPKDVVAYESPGIAFPGNDEDLVVGVVNVVSEASSAVKGLRRTALTSHQSNLTLTPESIEEVVRAALKQVS